ARNTAVESLSLSGRDKAADAGGASGFKPCADNLTRHAANGAQPSQLFSASQIAAALGRSKRGVLKALSGITPSGSVFPRGQQADAWAFDSLPQGIRAELAASAQKQRYRSVAQLLSAPPR